MFRLLQQQDDHLVGQQVQSDEIAVSAPTPTIYEASSSDFGSSLTRNTAYEERRSFNPMTDYVPRIEAMPETAPAYDELRKPVDFPRPQCVSSKRSCVCYTQQGTLMRDYPESVCRAYVKEGYFDATKPRNNKAQQDK